MEQSPYHQHRFPASSVGSPVTVRDGLPGDPAGYGTFNGASPHDPHAPLLPANVGRKSRMSVYTDLVPFASWFNSITSIFKKKPTTRPDPVRSDSTTAGKHVLIAGGGGNIPLEIIRCLSEYFAMLEERGTVPGTTLGGMIGLLQGLEDSLTSLERILTTPLPL